MENTPIRKSEPLTSSAYRELYSCDNVLYTVSIRKYYYLFYFYIVVKIGNVPSVYKDLL